MVNTFFNYSEAATVMRDDPDQFEANVKKSLKGGKVFGEDFTKFLK